ncbi:unnamed protein product [Strongylus vulgaris]|uniref:Uncharacterized protein n=1 Tax=Strongylus vulgaris TaxID=40348 RepID=A0A3P7KG25_STRVU|nr:unnamed protein product [Strongylus vulgaris]
MDVENVKIVDGLIFGYLGRQQYHDTLRALCNESPSLRNGGNRFQTGADVYIQVNDQLHDKNLEQIVQAFSMVGRFDVTPELIDFGIRLRNLTNEFSTMTSMRGRSLSVAPNSNDVEYVRQSHDSAINAGVAHGAQRQPISHQDLSYDYQSQVSLEVLKHWLA